MGNIPVRLIRRDGSTSTDIIGEIDTLRRALVCPVSWRRHYFWKCAAWTFDARTFQHFSTAIDLVNFEIEVGARRLVYALAKGEFLAARHTSVQCYDARRRYDEKYHIPAERWRAIVVENGRASVIGTVTEILEREFGKPADPPERGKQGELF